MNKKIKIILFHSHKGSKLFWKYLNKHWKEFGNEKIKIYQKYMKKEINLTILKKINPDIIILSDTSGTLTTFTENEIKDLKIFLENGGCKHLIGTYALFQLLNINTIHSNEKGIDNRTICEFFGINKNIEFEIKIGRAHGLNSSHVF